MGNVLDGVYLDEMAILFYKRPNGVLVKSLHSFYLQCLFFLFKLSISVHFASKLFPFEKKL